MRIFGWGIVVFEVSASVIEEEVAAVVAMALASMRISRVSALICRDYRDFVDFGYVNLLQYLRAKPVGWFIGN